MATLKSLKKQVEDANALGIANLTEQGVELSADATTYEIMQKIADVVGGDAVRYKSIVYNDDDTITLIDTDGVTHTMVCVYEDDKLSSVTYDGKEIGLHYTDDALDMIGKTEVDLSNAKVSGGASLDNTVTFVADGEPYEVVGVKNGNSVNAPATTPTSENGVFAGWQANEEMVVFPYTPTSDIELNAKFQAIRIEMEITGAITIINNQYVGTTKTYDDMCIAGYMGINWKSPFIVSSTENGVAVNSKSSLKKTMTVEYDNQTYYVRYDATTNWTDNYTQFDSRFYACSSTEINSAVVELLDHYFYKS
jgi:hypothetical protein